MKKALMELSKKELFILDHALRYYTAREGAPEKDVEEENALLDRVNDSIKELKRKRNNAKYAPKDSIKDGCILTNKHGFEFATFPSLGVDIPLDTAETMPIATFNDDLTSVSGKDYDIMTVSYNGEVLWVRK